jgi:hypothetical protein
LHYPAGGNGIYNPSLVDLSALQFSLSNNQKPGSHTKEATMRRVITVGCFGLLLTATLVCWADPPATEPLSPPSEKKTANTPAALKPMVVEEIANLRRQIGPSPLAGSLLGDADEGEFVEELRKLAESPTDAAPAGFASSAPLPLQTNDEALIDSLRQSARLLEAKANGLELDRSYSQADGYRRLAQHLRRAARGLDGTILP